jgi:acyl carrier protein
MYNNTANILSDVKKLLGRTLQLGSRTDTLTTDSPLLGALPELDSMAVVSLLTALEEHFGFSIADDEINADTFATLGSLLMFVEEKLRLCHR